FHEVAGGRRLGEDHQVDGWLELRELRQHPADPLQVGRVLALGGADLGNSDPRHGLKIGRQRAAWGGMYNQSVPPVAAPCRPVCLSQAMELASNRREG